MSFVYYMFLLNTKLCCHCALSEVMHLLAWENWDDADEPIVLGNIWHDHDLIVTGDDFLQTIVPYNSLLYSWAIFWI